MLEVWLQTATMREAGDAPVRLSLLTRQRSRVLDSGAAARAPHGQRLQPAARRPARLGHAVRRRTPDQAGSLLELTQGGKQPLTLPNGETRTFLRGRRHADPARHAASAKALAASASATVPARCCRRGVERYANTFNAEDAESGRGGPRRNSSSQRRGAEIAEVAEENLNPSFLCVLCVLCARVEKGI